MANQTLKTRILIRNDTAAAWTSANPVLAKGEIGVEIGADPSKNKIKIGDGTTVWNSLGYTYSLSDILDQIPSGCTTTQLTKTSLSTPDSTLLATITAPENGDVAVIKTVVDSVTYELSSYIYDSESATKAWVAITGPVDADKVIMRDDLILAGDYVNVGNIGKGSASATSTFSAKGKSVATVLSEIFAKRLQPSITSQPAVSGFALTSAGAKEAGTVISSTTFGTAKLSAGSYTYGPATGITATSYSVDRVCVPTSLSKTGVVAAASGTDNNSGSGFIIGDQGGTNVVSSLSYKVTVSHGAGAVANDNLGSASSPVVQIAAGSKTQATSAMTPYRNIFYGAVSTANPASGSAINSALVRGLTPTNNAYSARTLTVNVPAGATAVYIACIDGKSGVTKVINETALNADVTSTFVKQAGVMVEGASGYTAVAYNVWYFVPAIPYGNAAVLKVTLS